MFKKLILLPIVSMALLSNTICQSVKQDSAYDKNYIGSTFYMLCNFAQENNPGFIENRFFIEPSIAISSWPINTKVPDGFREQENECASFVLFIPGLHFGINF